LVAACTRPRAESGIALAPGQAELKVRAKDVSDGAEMALRII